MQISPQIEKVQQDIIEPEKRLDPVHARQRLGIEREHEGRVFGGGIIPERSAGATSSFEPARRGPMGASGRWLSRPGSGGVTRGAVTSSRAGLVASVQPRTPRVPYGVLILKALEF